ncbi:MAG TPA: hypothetical protein VEY33_11650 [Gemmatimonadota bacterium]|nr:hypothetical protein [Gemmatimonadota bacterium]
MSRLQATLLAFAAFAALAFPVAAGAQEMEEPDPPVLRLSFFICDLSGGNDDAIDEEIETRQMPIWNALADEGMIESYGYFFHWWADQWNVAIYTIAPTIQAIIDASAEAGDRLEAQYGEDAPSAIADHCPQHRDGFYTMGPNTDMDDEEGAAGGS